MQLYRRVGGLIVGPRKHRKAQLDQRRIERIDRVGKIQLQRVVGVQRSCPVDQRLRKLRVNAPIARLVGIGQGAARNAAANPQVIELCRMRAHTGLEVAQALAVGELRQGRRQELEACMRAHSAKLYHLGIRSRISRSTLADANESRDWRIYAEFAQSLIDRARPLYANDTLELDLANTVYALDSTLIELCLSMFPWAHYQSTHAAVKLHTLLELRGNIPSFLYISDGKLNDVAVLDQLLPEPGAFYVLDRGYIDYTRLYRFHQGRAFFVVRAKSNLKAQRRYSHPVDRS